MTTFSAIIVAHNDSGLRAVHQLHKQTRRPDEIVVLACCVDRATPYADISVSDVHHDDWGASKCDVGMRLATSDYVGFFAVDDEYQPHYIQRMLTTAEETGAEIVHCLFDSKNCGRMLDPRPEVGRITRGSFIVKRSFVFLALPDGYFDRSYEADGRFIEALKRCGARDVVVDELLYWHR